MNDTQTIKIFDVNNNLVDDFDDQVEKVLISVHGEKYYDIDEELQDTRLIPLNDILSNKDVKEEKVEHAHEVVKNIADKKKKKGNVKITDFLPVLFFMLLFAVIVAAGYFFLGNFDVTSVIGG
jgi:hypothetical protein